MNINNLQTDQTQFMALSIGRRIDVALIVEWQTASLAIYKSTYVLVESWTRAIHVKAQAIGYNSQ